MKLKKSDVVADVHKIPELRFEDQRTISRILAKVDPQAVENLRGFSRDLVLERLLVESLSRVTLDFDGSVLSTSRHAEGTAVGFNKKKKGARSYYPLFCTVAQTAQILDLHHRPGNVHDSNGARPFIAECFDAVREQLPTAKLEARLDSAFFNERQLLSLAFEGVEFTASVPFERFPQLKGKIENRKRWHRIDEAFSYFECDWKPESWLVGFRILVTLRQQLLHRAARLIRPQGRLTLVTAASKTVREQLQKYLAS